MLTIILTLGLIWAVVLVLIFIKTVIGELLEEWKE